MRRLVLIVGVLLIATIVHAAPEDTPDELLDQARSAFFESEDMVLAEKLYRRVVWHPDTTAEQRAHAHRYVGACLGRQQKYAEAIEVQSAWLAHYPDHDARHYTLLFQGVYFARLERPAEARACWQKIVDEAPDSEIAEHARRNLTGAVRAPYSAASAYQPGRVLLGEAGQPGGYVVVAVAPLDPGFRAVAQKAATFHKGELVDWDGADFDALAASISRRAPESVLFVVSPKVLDVNLHRQILMTSTTIDADIFPDFAFGYFTARDAPALEKLWARTEALHANGLKTRVWHATAVTSGMKSTVYEDSVDPAPKAAGFTGNHYYFATLDQDPETMAFVERRLADLEQASVITMTGCGDPQGIWLFSDQRNADRSKHWPYDPDKVGDDPEGEMPRIMADRFAALELKSPIIWTGVCHQGALHRVFVEGDIVSTFGRTEHATLFELPLEQSISLAMIDAGATAFLCPIGANHGMAVSREVEFVLENGATLGEAVKSTYDDIHLAARGMLVLDIQVDGQPHANGEYVMQGGGANRILIGDPALAPFEATPHPTEKTEIQGRTETGFEVVVTWQKGFHARGWDMYGRDRARDWTIRARIPLDGLVPENERLAFIVTVSGVGADGKVLPYVMSHAEPEAFHGRRTLHLQANADRKAVAREYAQATFTVTFERDDG